MHSFSFLGITSTKIYWENVQWILESEVTSVILKLENHFEYPFGNQNWIDENGEIIKLHFSECNHDEFNCDDGQCVEQIERCDGNNDCKDTSDELQCDLVLIDESYSKGAIPVGVVLFVHLKVYGILLVDEINSCITVQYKLNLTWVDRRVTYLNLRKYSFLNIVSDSDMASMWHPIIQMYNTKNRDQTIFDQDVTMMVNNYGSKQHNTKDHLQNEFEYTGWQNSISMLREYSNDFICDFNMAMYPFDIQICNMIFTQYTNEEYMMEPEYLKYHGSIDLTEYYIISFDTFRKTSSGVEVEIVFGRRINNKFVTIYLPSILITLISFATNYFPEVSFEANVTVNLSTLLILITMFVNISGSLPKTTYIKYVDIWFIFSIMFPFVEVILHTIIIHANELMLNDKKKKKSTSKYLYLIVKMAKLCTRLIVIVYFVLLAAYGIYGISSKGIDGKSK